MKNIFQIVLFLVSLLSISYANKNSSYIELAKIDNNITKIKDKQERIEKAISKIKNMAIDELNVTISEKTLHPSGEWH